MKRNHLVIIAISISVVATAILIASFATGTKASPGSLASTSSGTDNSTLLVDSGYNTTPNPTVTQKPTLASSPTPVPSPTVTTSPTVAPTQPQTTVPDSTPVSTSQPSEIAWYEGYADPRTITAEIVSNPEDLTVLVNKFYAIPDDYIPSLVLAESSKNQSIRPEAAEAWNAMRAVCTRDTGENLYLCSGYRTFATQSSLFSNSIKNKGVAHAISRNAYPGRSEHNLGLALDISTTSVKQISSGFAETTAGAWVTEHAHEFGFIIRYPSGKSSITGYVYEPWHLRYVGIDLANTLHDFGQTLEEYYGKVPALP